MWGGQGAGPWPCPHPRTWARLRPGLGVFHLGGSTGRWPELPTLQEQIHYDRLAESLLGHFHLSARCGLTQQASFQSLWTSVPPPPTPAPTPCTRFCSVGPGLNPYSLQQSRCRFTQDHLGPPGGRPDAGGVPADGGRSAVG